MPLMPGSSRAAFSSNVAELRKSNPKRPLKQDLAIAYSERRRTGRTQSFHDGLK